MREITVRAALCEAMAEEMRRDENVFLLGEEVAEYHGAYKVSDGLWEEFGGGRVIDTPITEHAFTGLAVGAALSGLRPIVEFMTFNFAMQAIDQIINSAAKTRYMSGGTLTCPIVFRGPNGAAARVGAQHSQCYASWFAHCPGIRVISPFDAESAKGLLKAAIRDPNPVVFLENEILYGQTFPISDSVEPLSLNRMRVIREGKNLTLVGFSVMTGVCLQAAEILAKDYGLHAEVIDACILRPFDAETIVRSVSKTHHIITVEEGWPVCGIGSEVAAVINAQAFDALDAPPVRITGLDIPLPYAHNLERLSLPCVQQVVDAALGFFSIGSSVQEGVRLCPSSF